MRALVGVLALLALGIFGGVLPIPNPRYWFDWRNFR